MEWPFNLLDELPHVVKAETRTQTQRPCLHFKRRGRRTVRFNVQSEAKVFVDKLLERAAGAARLGAQFGGNVVIQGQGGSHITMLLE